MRVAAISDVHGNAFALEAVLREVKLASPDLVVNLGDQVEGSADPGRAAQIQAELTAVEVRGNNEEKWWPGGRRSPLSQSLGRWLEPQLPHGTVERLSALPLMARIDDLLVCHGTPESAWDSLLWVWEDRLGPGFYRSRDPRELWRMVEPLEASLLLCGHTHRPGATRVGGCTVVNVGAVSDQVDGDPSARWSLLERRGAEWTVDFRRVPYDVKAAMAWVHAHSPFAPVAAELLRSGEMTARSVGPL